MPLLGVLLVVPSHAAAVEWPRRLAARSGALAGFRATKLLDLARAIAEPALLAGGHRPWTSGHDALLAGLLLDGPHGLALGPELPMAPVAAALARTLRALRQAGVAPARVLDLARAAEAPEDEIRLRALSALLARYLESLEGRFADPWALLRSASERVHAVDWLRGLELLVVGSPELEPAERGFLAALARVMPARFVDEDGPGGLAPTRFGSWARGHGLQPSTWSETALAPAAPPPPPGGLERLRRRLFEPPGGEPVWDGSVELLTAPGEAAEVRAIVRRLLREATRGVPFEEMGVILARPEIYAPLFTDLLTRLRIPHRLHPSLPLRFGRAARSILLLLRCRGLERPAVMEFLTFAPVPFREILGEEEEPHPAQWDALSRDAGIVSGLPRWLIGLRSHAEHEREAAARESDPDRRGRREGRAHEAEKLLRVVELVSSTLDGLSGEASWPEWSERLRGVVAQWLGPERDTEAVAEVVADLAALGALESRVPWRRVEDVLSARLEWERLPLDPSAGGAIHVGALEAMAGLPFRVVALPGLVEGGFPGVLRPDPFLLDPERAALVAANGSAAGTRSSSKPARRGRGAARRQMALVFADGSEPALAEPARELPGLPTTQDRLLETRRLFLRAVSQATERLILAYPRADARSGRERMPSLFLVAAASALAGRPLGSLDLERALSEDDLAELPEEAALDPAERDRARVRRGGREAALQIAAGSRFFAQSHLASEARWSRDLTPYDGLVAYSARDADGPEAALAERVRRALDPLRSPRPVSASRLAVYSRCGFQYFLAHVLRLSPALEPEERTRLLPLEKGDRFHRVAEAFLRRLRDTGGLPVRNTEEQRRMLVEMAEASLDELVAGSPPRFTLLWERERRLFRESMLAWLAREAKAAERATPAHFELAFGTRLEAAPGEPHLEDPLAIELGEGRTLRVAGKIDRIDRKPDGTLLLRDYKTGRAPRDDGSVFRGGKNLQIPFYVLAAERAFPGARVSEAFLDYVDGGRQVAISPALAGSPEFRALLRGLVDAIAGGLFVQEHTACEWCDYTLVCGPAPLLAERRQRKLNDPRVQAVLRLRDL